jgi:hypothetical protein
LVTMEKPLTRRSLSHLLPHLYNPADLVNPSMLFTLSFQIPWGGSAQGKPSHRSEPSCKGLWELAAPEQHGRFCCRIHLTPHLPLLYLGTYRESKETKKQEFTELQKI